MAVKTEWRGVGISLASTVALSATFVLWQSHLFLWLALSVGIGATVAFLLTIYATALAATMVGGSVGLAFAFAWLLLSTLLPPEIDAFAGSSNYADGADIYGVHWKAGLTSADVYIENKTKDSYEDLDFLISTNLSIYGVGLKQDGNQCAVAPSHGSLKVISARVFYPDTNGKMISELPDLFQYYRIHCDKFISKSALSVIIATPKVFFTSLGHGERAPLEWVSFRVNYTTNGRKGEQSVKTICLVKQCHDIPKENKF